MSRSVAVANDAILLVVLNLRVGEAEDVWCSAESLEQTPDECGDDDEKTCI